MRGTLRTAALSAIGLVGVEAAPAAEPPPAWKLGLNDVARYTTKTTKKKGNDVIVDDGPPLLVHGHALAEDGLYRPVGLRRGDLSALFAFRTPAAGAFQWRFDLLDTTTLRVDGAAIVATQSDKALELRVDAKFASAGKPGDHDEFVIRDGTARAVVAFDRVAGVVASARVELSYEREKTDPKRTDKPAHVVEQREFTLAGVSTDNYAAFRAEVNAAIDRGVARLAKLQKADGNFEPYQGQELGTTALCAYTLVSCGVPAADERVEKALAFICASTPMRTYEQAVGLMAVERTYTPPEELASARRDETRRPRDVPAARRQWCERTAAALEAACSAPGSWGYPNAGNDRNRADSSNTQYAVLGLQAASRLGIAVADSTWLGVLRHFAQARDPEGPKGAVSLLRTGQAVTEKVYATPVARVAGFRYRPNERRTWGSMTCAGIASLSIARDELRRMKRLSAKDEAEIDEAVFGAWAWLDAHWALDRHPEKDGDEWYYYWLYALERAALLTGVQRVGGRDWYFGGAAELLARQAKDGGWNERRKEDTTETCFALLFLKRATAPLTPR
jgi:hypothetical protein